MKTFAEIPLNPGGGRILRVERRIDERAVSHVRLHVINPKARRGPTEGPVIWIPPAVLPALIAALQATAASFEPAKAEVPCQN
jgi:hypothetical protein